MNKPAVMTQDEVKTYLASRARDPEFTQALVEGMKSGVFEAYMGDDGEMMVRLAPGLSEEEVYGLLFSENPAIA
jgi:hypothetical protein